MKIVAPISRTSELDMLLYNGADELYCGIQTPEWEKHFNQTLWMNRRSPNHANINSLDDLELITRIAHENHVSVNITLNAPFYPQKGLDYILRLGQLLACEIQVDALIVSDLNLLLALFKENLPVRIHLSSLGGCFNSHSVEFYKCHGVKRIILPRQLTLYEMKTIIRNNNDQMEFEVFALNDGCYYEEGFCQTSHTLGPFCLTNFQIRAKRDPKQNSRLSDIISTRQHHFKNYVWYQNNCGSSFQKDGLPNGPCSLCNFGLFREWGVTGIKIVGREGSFHRKMSSLQLVRALRDKSNNTEENDRIETYARELRQTPEYCDTGYMCYFRNS